MRFGEPLDDERFAALVRPGGGIGTVITADAYGAGRGGPRCSAARWPACRATTTRWSARSGTTSTRASARARRASRASPTRGCAAPRATRTTCGWRPSAASSAAASTPSTCCCCTTPTAPATPARRSGTRSRPSAPTGLTARLGVAPGPANGFTLDVIDCFERFGERIDWAMVILNPLEPWPGELVLPAAERHGVELITRVVDYGGLFHDDVLPGHPFPRVGPPHVPPAGLDRARPRAAGAHAPDRRAPRADDAAARVRVEPRPRARCAASRRR